MRITGPVFAGMVLTACLAGCDAPQQAATLVQPEIDARVKLVLHDTGYRFKDLNRSGRLDPYEDWRLPVEERVEDLLGRMSLEEKVGMMLIDTLNADIGGRMTGTAVRYIREEKMTRFIFRNPITRTPGYSFIHPWSGPEVTPSEAAQFMNIVQETAEATRLGIPLLFKSNPRNHVDPDPKFGISAAAGALSAWPKPAGLAAARDTALIEDFAATVRAEWTSLGLRGMYGYTLDLATEPRWFRVHETFSEDADLVADIATTLVRTLQGRELGGDSVALTMKHFPGGGPQEGGGDPHYDFGKRQVYPAGNFDYHVKPFRAAIDAGVAAVMPYYGIPVDQSYKPDDVGMSFSKGIVTDLLRGELGFNGVVNSDTGIIGERSWGLEDKTEAERLVIAIEAGNDVLSGFHSNEKIRDLVTSGQLSETRVDESVRRLLAVQFRLGLFEDPYLDADRADYLVGNTGFQQQAAQAQRKSLVLLQNSDRTLPLHETTDRPLKLYTMGLDVAMASGEPWKVDVTAGDYDPGEETRPAIPADVDAAVIRVIVNNEGARRDLFFGGANPDELDKLSFSEMAVAASWQITPSLKDIRAVMAEAGADKTILAIYFRQPYVLDEASGLRDAGAILATFGVTDAVLLDVITGRFVPSGKLPFALAGTAAAIVDQPSDAPGYDEERTLYPLGFGLSYAE